MLRDEWADRRWGGTWFKITADLIAIGRKITTMDANSNKFISV